MVLASTQPLREMSTRSITWAVKMVGAMGCRLSRTSGNPTL
jgi:hypothetical protein